MAKRISTSAKAARRRRRKSQKLAMERAKEFLYKGYTIEELEKMKLDKLIELLPARARRSLRRGWNDEQAKLVEKLAHANNKVIKTHVRDLIILPKFIGKRIMVYNGKEYIEFEVKPEMVGHYLGEFALTRGMVRHSSPGVGATKSSKYVPLK